jgi:hypothetical protein
MNPLEYLHLQLRLEGKEVFNGDQLRQVEAVPDEEMPLMILAQLADKQFVAYYDESISPELYAELRHRIRGLMFSEIQPLLEFLTTQNISVDIGHYKTYIIPAQLKDASAEVKCLHKGDVLVQAFGFGGFAEHVYAVERDGKIVSACVSTRENQFCGEAWVFTAEAYRNQGFARQTVLAWGKAMLNAGKVPFYSHKIENITSANLAKRLELKSVFEEIGVSYTKQ